MPPVNVPPPPPPPRLPPEVRPSPADTGSSIYRLSPSAPVMRNGARGDHVRGLQERLNAVGYAAGPVDGDFGPRTRRAVVDFQRANGLQVDGIAGPQTISALLRAPRADRGRSGEDSFVIDSSRRSNSYTGRSTPPPVIGVTNAASTTNSTERSGTLTTRLHEWYTQPENFRRVRNSIAGTRNMCANYITTAMQMSGVLNIPRSASYVGFDDNYASSVRMWAPSLAKYMEKEEGWNRVYDIRTMKPGDVLFTNGREGTYNHVMMLDSWVNRNSGIARVTDNQGFSYTRNLYGGVKSPVTYALRK